MFEELRKEMKDGQDASTAKIESLESQLASAKDALDTANQERAEMAGKLRLLRAHAESDCRSDQYYNLNEEKCHDCSEDTARFYSEMLDECMQCSEVADRFLNDDGVCELLKPCGKGEYISKKPTDSSPQECATVQTCAKDEFESAAPGRATDRGCSSISECKTGSTFETAASTAFADRQCTPVGAECDFPTFFEAAAPGDRTDRVCKEVAECIAPAKELKSPTKSSDRVRGLFSSSRTQAFLIIPFHLLC